jgi:ElaB/YqjD/DUF883 family membrane-anchored ribosome-binding protein
MDGIDKAPGLMDWIIGGGFLTLVGFAIATYVKVGKIKDEIFVSMKEMKKDTDAAIEKVKGEAEAAIEKLRTEADTKVSRVYERLDETKTKADNTFARKDFCQTLHSQINESLSSIREKVESIPVIRQSVMTLLRKAGLMDKIDS